MPIGESSLSANQTGQVFLNRREFLKSLGIVTAGAIALAACVPTEDPTESTPTAVSTEPRPLSPEEARAKLLGLIENLPESPAKNALSQIVAPIYDGTVRALNYEGVTIPIHPTIGESFLPPGDEAMVRGSFNSRKDMPMPIKAHFPREAVDIRIPLVGLFTETEKKEFPPENMVEGEPVISMGFATDKAVYTGLFPQILVEKKHPLLLTEADHPRSDAMIEFTYIKEALGMVLNAIHLEQTIKKMNQLSFDTHITMQSGEDIEVVSQAVSELTHNQGRLIAAFDIAAYLLAVKAFENTNVIDFVSQDPLLGSVLPFMTQIELDGDPTRMMFQALEWAITTPEARSLYHAGDMNKIPYRFENNSVAFSASPMTSNRFGKTLSFLSYF